MDVSSLRAIEVVSIDDCRAASRFVVNGTVSGVVAALDTSTRTTRFNELDVVTVAHATTPLGGTSIGAILTPYVVRVQSVERRRKDTPCDCKSELAIDALPD